MEVKQMADIDLWPSLLFLFAGTNLAAWYFKGAPLFSWWWLLPVAIVQILFAAAILAIAKAAASR